MVAGYFPPSSMELPCLKYYLPSPLNLKIKMFVTQSALVKLEADHSMRPGIECCIYSRSNPCQKKFLDFIKTLLMWCKKHPLKEEMTTPLKGLCSSIDSSIAAAIQTIPFGNRLTPHEFLSIYPHLSEDTLIEWIKKNPYPLIVPTHRLMCENQLSSKQRCLFSYLVDAESNAIDKSS